MKSKVLWKNIINSPEVSPNYNLNFLKKAHPMTYSSKEGWTKSQASCLWNVN